MCFQPLGLDFRACTALAKPFASSMRGWEGSFAFAANFPCIPLPYRRCPLATHDAIIVQVFAFCSPSEILGTLNLILPGSRFLANFVLADPDPQLSVRFPEVFAS
jgi:hypothetical protein